MSSIQAKAIEIKKKYHQIDLQIEGLKQEIEHLEWARKVFGETTYEWLFKIVDDSELDLESKERIKKEFELSEDQKAINKIQEEINEISRSKNKQVKSILRS